MTRLRLLALSAASLAAGLLLSLYLSDGSYTINVKLGIPKGSHRVSFCDGDACGDLFVPPGSTACFRAPGSWLEDTRGSMTYIEDKVCGISQDYRRYGPGEKLPMNVITSAEGSR